LSDNDIIISADELRAYAASIVRAGGSTPEEAAKVAAQLVEANLRGHDSHGVSLLPDYVRNVRAGTLKPNQGAEIAKETDVIAVIDGHHGYGQVVGEQAMEIGIAKAKGAGLALVAIRRTHHLGRIGHWAEQCCAAGMASIHFTSVASNASVAPWGGSDARYGTNPFTCGVPVDGDEPIILDMATSRLPVGKVRVAHNKGQKVVPGALIDADGKHTTDPGVYFRQPRGTLLPFGEHKGYALALIVELFAGALTGGGTIRLGPDAPKGIINNMVSVIIDPGAIGDARTYYEEVAAMAGYVKESPPAGDTPVMVPGDPERCARRERLARGIPVDAGTWRAVGEAARTIGVTPPR
jgi:hydroxycarboxylate dehydrogenase B